MTDPFIDSLATALAGQAVAALSAAGAKALSGIRDLVRRKSEQDTDLQAALEAAEEPSAGQEQIDVLAERLDQDAKDDVEFAERLRSVGTTVHKEISGRNVNKFSGNAKNVIQADTIQGPITLN